jgi:hypothetical protein
MTALRRLGREEVHMMNFSAQCATLLSLKRMVFRVCLEDVLEGTLSFSASCCVETLYPVAAFSA